MFRILWFTMSHHDHLKFGYVFGEQSQLNIELLFSLGCRRQHSNRLMCTLAQAGGLLKWWYRKWIDHHQFVSCWIRRDRPILGVVWCILDDLGTVPTQPPFREPSKCFMAHCSWAASKTVTVSIRETEKMAKSFVSCRCARSRKIIIHEMLLRYPLVKHIQDGS